MTRRNSSDRSERGWLPTALAGGIAILLVWLAGDPLALRPEDVRAGGPLWWGGDAFLRVADVAMIEPRDDQPAFPSRFRWRAVPGANDYEIAIGRDSPGSRALMRRSVVTTSVEIGIGAGMPSPGPGDYVWEVRARRGQEYVARSVTRFRVTSGP